MHTWNKILIVMLSIALGTVATAQKASAAINEDDKTFMRSEGKIYVVMTIVITILSGLIIYLVRLDWKLTRLENGTGV